MEHVGRTKSLMKAANIPRLELARKAEPPVVDRGVWNKVSQGGRDVSASSFLHISSDVDPLATPFKKSLSYTCRICCDCSSCKVFPLNVGPLLNRDHLPFVIFFNMYF